MADKIEGLKKELVNLMEQGELLLCAMAVDVGKINEEDRKYIKENNIQVPNFVREYDKWYTESLRVIKQIIPERLDDFINQYRNDRRKSLSHSTYTIYDYLLGIIKRGQFNSIILNTDSALPKMQHQVSILNSVLQRFSSSLFDVKEVLQADIFDSELEAAREL